MLRALACACLLATAAPAWAQEASDNDEYCANRGGLTEATCTLSPGEVSVEVGLIDWTRDAADGDRSVTLAAGDVLVRLPLRESTEVQLGWTAYGRRVERVGGVRSTREGVGDVYLAVRQVLLDDSVTGFAVAAMPYATLPIGNDVLGSGDWVVGLLLPMTYSIGNIELLFTPQIAAAVNGDRRGRHLLLGAAGGIAFPLGRRVTGIAELAYEYDDDPLGRTESWVAALSATWLPRPNLQLDLGAVFGLNDQAPDIQLLGGVSRRF